MVRKPRQRRKAAARRTSPARGGKVAAAGVRKKPVSPRAVPAFAAPGVDGEIAALRTRIEVLEREVRLKDSALLEREAEVRGLYARIAQQVQEIQRLTRR